MKRASDRARVFAAVQHLGIDMTNVPPLHVTSHRGIVQIHLSQSPGVDFVIQLSRERFEEWMDHALRMTPGAFQEMLRRAQISGQLAAFLGSVPSAAPSPFDN